MPLNLETKWDLIGACPVIRGSQWRSDSRSVERCGNFARQLFVLSRTGCYGRSLTDSPIDSAACSRLFPTEKSESDTCDCPQSKAVR